MRLKIAAASKASASLDRDHARAAPPFAFPGFRFFWLARFCSTLAQTSMVVVIGWQVYDTARLTMGTKEAAFQLGVVGLAQFLPLFLLTLVTGWTADRFDRRMVARLSICLQLLCGLSLAWLVFAGRSSLPALFLIASLLGVARAFSVPATSALGPNLVPPDVVPQAIATTSIGSRVGAILGPTAGGYLYLASPSAPYLFSACLWLISIIALTFIRPIRRSAIPVGTRNSWQRMLDGIAYVRTNKLVLGAISLDLFAVLLGGATALMPVFARDILHAGASGLGHLRAAPAIGALLSAIYFANRPLRARIGAKMLAAVGIFGAATIVFGLSKSMPLSLFALVALGAADMLSVYVRQSLIQINTPDEMRGRVGAVSALFISASNELGEAESGFVAALIGPIAAVVGGGLGALFLPLLWARWFPTLLHVGGFHLPPSAKDGKTPT